MNPLYGPKTKTTLSAKQDKNLEQAIDLHLSTRIGLRTGAARETWFDERGELHKEDGAAVVFENGDELFYWHGAKISSEQLTAFQTTYEFVDGDLPF